VAALVVQKLSVFFFSDCGLHLINGLLDEHAILNVENPVGVALQLRIVSDHDACCAGVLALAGRTHAVNVQQQIHYRDYIIRYH
jgi:hypothetical protein